MIDILSIDHIGIAVNEINDALKAWSSIFGLDVSKRERINNQGVLTATLPIGKSKIELLEPIETYSTVAKFINKRGEGIHHIGFRVSNIEDALKKLKDANIKLIDEIPRNGTDNSKIAFLHPRNTNGVLLELCER